MTNEQIIEGNKIVDEFNDNYLQRLGFNSLELNYHVDWNHLMMTVEKIESWLADDCFFQIGYQSCDVTVLVGNYFKGYTENDGFDIRTQGQTKIEAVYNAVIEFIKWYNHEQSLSHFDFDSNGDNVVV